MQGYPPPQQFLGLFQSQTSHLHTWDKRWKVKTYFEYNVATFFKVPKH